MSTAAWAPVDDTIPPLRWWAAVICGGLTPLLLTPLGDLLDPIWLIVVLVVLTLVAVGCGLPPAFARAWRELTTQRRVGGATLLAAACVLALLSSVTFFFAGIIDGFVAIALAAAAHLVAARVLTTVLRVVPGAVSPGTLPAGDPAKPRGLLTRVDVGLRWLPTAVGVLAILVVLGWTLLRMGDLPWFGFVEGSFAALSILLVASPAAFWLARVLPTRAARDRGRELGIRYGDVDLLRLARVRHLALDPIGVVTDPRPRLVGVHTLGRLQATAALQAAASVADDGGTHPAHAALVGAARDRALALRPAEPIDGNGPTRRGRIKDTVVTLGTADAFDRVPTELLDRGSTLFVGWGGIARAGFELVPTVRSEALADWPELSALQIDPVFGCADEVALRHVGSALELRDQDMHVVSDDAHAAGDDARTGPVTTTPPTTGRQTGMRTTWRSLIEDLRALAPVAVVGVHGTEDDPDVFVLTDAPARTEDGPHPRTPSSSTTVRLTHADLSGAVRALALARKASRVTTQGLVLVAVVHLITLPLAALAILEPTVAAVVGAGLPLLVAANGLRPRSFDREHADA